MWLAGLVLLIALVALLMAPGCAASKAREGALWPAMQTAWPGVRADVERGIQDGAEGGYLLPAEASGLEVNVRLMTDALAGEYAPSAVLAAGWGDLRPWAEIGVQAQLDADEIGPVGAGLLRDRILQFDAAVMALGGGR